MRKHPMRQPFPVEPAFDRRTHNIWGEPIYPKPHIARNACDTPPSIPAQVVATAAHVLARAELPVTIVVTTEIIVHEAAVEHVLRRVVAPPWGLLLPEHPVVVTEPRQPIAELPAVPQAATYEVASVPAPEVAPVAVGCNHRTIACQCLPPREVRLVWLIIAALSLIGLTAMACLTFILL